ncbi:HECT domain-containing protein [Candidatus Nitrosopelagicus sp.]|nr:HECT domain-containing protein [Candidatus Nitrosopelagicus sp.]
MMKSHNFFKKMVDELVDFSEFDPELADGIKWLDAQAQKKGITFYDMVYEVLYTTDINSKARNWLKTRN